MRTHGLGRAAYALLGLGTLAMGFGCGDDTSPGGGGPLSDARPDAVQVADGRAGDAIANLDSGMDAGLDAQGPDGNVGDAAVGGDGGPGVTIVTRDPLPDGIVGRVYNFDFQASGGNGTYSWTGVSVPFGSIDGSGHWTGTPTQAGPVQVTVRVESGGSLDQETFHLTVYDPLSVDLGGQDYLVGHPGLDLSQLAQGGKGSVQCWIYRGAGGGTVPPGIQQDPADPSGCRLTGTIDATAMPGTYGFLMVVHDELGQTAEVPVAYQGRPCADGSGSVNPSEWPPRVEAAGSSYQWSLILQGLNYPCEDTGCSHCRSCLNMFLFSTPLDPTQNLQCANTGDVCSDCQNCFVQPTTCPGLGSMTRPVLVKQHQPIRQGLAWETLEITLHYTGDDLQNCGPNQWQCHIEVLER